MESTFRALHEIHDRKRKDRNCIIVIFILLTIAEGVAKWIA